MQRSPTLLIFLVSTAIVLAFGLWLDQSLLPQLRQQNRELSELNQRVQKMQEDLALLHFSAKIEGQPLEQVLEHIEYWAQQRDEKRPSVIDEDIYKEKLELGKQALLRLGSSIFDRLMLEFRLPEKQKKLGYRFVLLEILHDIDPQRAIQAYSEVLQNQSLDSRFRDLAARLLVGIDANVAGRVLQTELLRSKQIGPVNLKLGTSRTSPGFLSILRYYMETPHIAKRETLHSILRTSNHRTHVYTEAVKYLGDLGGGDSQGLRQSIHMLKRLFEEGAPHPSAGDTMNPLFRRHCAQAVAKLGGASACNWLREQMKREQDRALVGVLAQLVRKHCP